MSYAQSVITEIRGKDFGEFEVPINLGFEQKNISSLLNSHNNNFEEQSILGVDSYSIMWTENDTNYTTKKFYNGDLATVSDVGYYILFIENFSKLIVDSNNPTLKISQRETLCFRKDISNTSDKKINSDILISTKTIYKKVDGDKIYTIEDIINYL